MSFSELDFTSFYKKNLPGIHITSEEIKILYDITPYLRDDEFVKCSSSRVKELLYERGFERKALKKFDETFNLNLAIIRYQYYMRHKDE